MRRRLDVEMVRRRLATNRTEAASAIRDGKVAVAGRPALKAGTLVLPEEPISLAAPARRFVSRGGDKLDAALERFAVSAAGRQALDSGASTGGFTDCLLQRGAAHVVALDVGYGQLHWRLRQDPRVTVVERSNVRELRLDMLPYGPDLLTADLSFISLRLALPALAAVAVPGADLILLVKPQFEAGRDSVGQGGVVSDPEVWRTAVDSVASASGDLGLESLHVMASPLLGPAGNSEFLLHARATGVGARRSPPDLDQAVEEARALAGARRG